MDAEAQLQSMPFTSAHPCYLPLLQPAGTAQPQLQLRMDIVEPSTAAGGWENVAASCVSAAVCIDGGVGTTADPLQVLVKLDSVPNPLRVSFV